MVSSLALFALIGSAHGLRLTSPLSRRTAVTVAAAASATTAIQRKAVASDELTYTILDEGDTTSPLPQRGQTAIVDYTLWIGDFEGKQIDTSKGTALPPRLPSPFKFNVGVGAVIPGWDKSVKTMHVGEKRRIVVPPSLGYGEKGVGPIPGGANLYFEVELLELKPMPKFTEKQLEWLATHPEP